MVTGSHQWADSIRRQLHIVFSETVPTDVDHDEASALLAALIPAYRRTAPGQPHPDTDSDPVAGLCAVLERLTPQDLTDDEAWALLTRMAPAHARVASHRSAASGGRPLIRLRVATPISPAGRPE